MDPAATEHGTDGISYWHIPHGKQSWYVQTSGIWQSVELQRKPDRYIKRVHITCAIDGSIAVDAVLHPSTKARSEEIIHVTVFDPIGKNVLTLSRKIFSTDEIVRFAGKVDDPMLWSVASPNLYRAELSLGERDVVTERFGFRSIEAKNTLLYLNGQPFYLIGALGQDFYPETIYTTPSEDYLRDEMMKAKAIGLNMLRCHIKIPDPRYLKVADEIGLLVWYEIPSWYIFTSEAGRRALETLDAMLERDWNHPSLVIISLVNESWGLNLQEPEQRAWLKDAVHYAKQKAIGRLIVDNSACWGNFHLKTDINDYHTYWAIPEKRHRFDQTITDIAGRPQWLFSTFGDAEETRDEPLILSEFGNWGLPKLPHSLPWWIERDFLGREITLPKDIHKRFSDFALDKIFGTFDQLAEESQRAQFDALKYEIEQLRLNSALQGYVITQFTDINWEANGLLDMWRNVKVYGDDLAHIQQQDVIIPRPIKYNYWSDEIITIRLWISHYSPAEIYPATLEWSFSSGQKGIREVPRIHRTEVREISPISFTAEKITSPQRLRVHLHLKTAQGKILAQNYCDVFLYPKQKIYYTPVIHLYDPFKKLKTFEHALQISGYTLTEKDIRSLVVTNVVDDEVMKSLDRGQSVLCLVDSLTKPPVEFPFTLISREREWYGGNWATNFNWSRYDALPFRSFNWGKRLGFEAAAILPEYVIGNIPPAYFSDVLAGMSVGWLHLNSAYIIQMNCGKGKLLLCTLRLDENISDDPYAAILFDNLVEYLQKGNCSPRLTWEK